MKTKFTKQLFNVSSVTSLHYLSVSLMFYVLAPDEEDYYIQPVN